MADEATALEVIFDLIKANSPAGKTFMGFTPDSDGLVREVVESDMPPMLTFTDQPAVECQRINIGVRGDPEQYTAPRNEILRLKRVINSAGDYMSRGIQIVGITQDGGVRHEGRDDKRREQFSVGFNVWWQEAEGA